MLGNPRSVARAIILACCVLLLAPRSAAAQDDDARLKEFQTAINYMQDKQGCRSIPYPNIQESCVRKSAQSNRMCKESGPWSCGDVDPKRMQREIEELKTKRDAARAEIADLERQQSSATDDAAKHDVEGKLKEAKDRLENIERARDPLERQVDEATKAVNDRTYVAKACRDAREEVAAVFREAKSEAARENDAAIAPLAKRLIAFWESEEGGHNDAITNAKNAVETCDRVLYEIGHLGRISMVPAAQWNAHRAGVGAFVLFANPCHRSQFATANGGGDLAPFGFTP